MMSFLFRLFGGGSVTRIDDTGDVQTMQVTRGVQGDGPDPLVKDDVLRLGEFGLASVPPLGSEVMMVRMGAQATHPVVIATSHRASRPTGLQPGDSGLYDVRAAHVFLTETGVEIDAAGAEVTIRNASKVRVECELLECTGDVVSRCDGVEVSLNSLRDAYDEHDHPPTAGAGTWGSGPPNDQV